MIEVHSDAHHTNCLRPKCQSHMRLTLETNAIRCSRETVTLRDNKVERASPCSPESPVKNPLSKTQPGASERFGIHTQHIRNRHFPNRQGTISIQQGKPRKQPIDESISASDIVSASR